MKKFRILHHCAFIALSLVVICHFAYLFGEYNEPLNIPNSIEMTPDEFEKSIHIDERDLNLDSALDHDLRANIDSVNNTPQRTVVQRKPSRPLQPKKYPAPTSSKAHPPVTLPGEEDTIEFQFEDADLQVLLRQMAELYHVTFITDDTINPPAKGGKPIQGNKISFKTNQPLDRAQAWNLFLTFLDIAELAVVPEANPTIFRIMSTANAKKSPIPTFIGVKPEALPENDQLIRYLYFIENGSLETINEIVNSLRSSASAFLVLKDLNGFLLTDKANNIRSLMNIITELDKATMPQSMSVLKLMRADANDVKKLYDSIIQTDDNSITARLFPARKQPTTLFFPENTRIIAEPRTNSLILLGPLDAIKKIEDFITKYVDVELGEESMSPLRVYPLKYALAESVAAIMNDITQFGKGSAVGTFGGVRDNDKYIKSLTFIAEPSTNRLVIKGDEGDYLQALEIIKKLDEPQPQIAMEVLILSVDLLNNDQLGAQLRSKYPGINGPLGPNIQWQTSGLSLGTTSGIITNSSGPGAERLLGNLINLVTGAGAGNTVLTLGSDQFGVWGIFNALQTVSNTQIISNPFLVATNKQKAKVSIGETRRVISSTIVSAATTANSQANDAANLSVEVTPQINSDGMIVLNLDIEIDAFTNTTNQQDGTKDTKEIRTTTVVADNEVLALGGLIKNTIATSVSKVPILGDIPLLGWFFKTKTKAAEKTSLLILISTHILPPDIRQDAVRMTQERIQDYHNTIDAMHEPSENRDPINRGFFAEKSDTSSSVVDNFLFHRQQIRDNALKVAHDTKGSRPTGKRTRKNKNKNKKLSPVLQGPNTGFLETKIITQHEPTYPAKPTMIGAPLMTAQLQQTTPITSQPVAAYRKPRQYTNAKQSLSNLLSNQEKGVVA